MAKYRKKPVVIDAAKWDANDFIGDVLKELNVDKFKPAKCEGIKRQGDKLIITTLEGDMTADNGDYIIKDVNGELYPCKPDIFKKTYELAE